MEDNSMRANTIEDAVRGIARSEAHSVAQDEGPDLINESCVLQEIKEEMYTLDCRFDQLPDCDDHELRIDTLEDEMRDIKVDVETLSDKLSDTEDWADEDNEILKKSIPMLKGLLDLFYPEPVKSNGMTLEELAADTVAQAADTA